MFKVVASFRYIRPGQSGGIAQYARDLVAALAECNDVEVHLLETFYNYKHYCDSTQSSCRHHLLTNPGQYDQQIVDKIRAIRPQAVFYPVPGDPFAAINGTRYVSVIPDLQHETYPQFFSLRDILARRKSYGSVVAETGMICTLSEHAKREIQRVYGLPEEKVQIVLPALAPEFLSGCSDREVQETHKKFGIKGDYIYYPANYWKHKNHTELLRGLAILKRRGQGVILVLSGHRMGRACSMREEAARFGVADLVKEVGYVSQADVKCMLRGARAMIFPSLFEGFGMPLLEAFEMGVPVACSARTSLMEIGRDAAIYFDPEQPEEIADCIARLFTDHKLVSRLLERGARQRCRFDYTTSAATLLAAMQSLWQEQHRQKGKQDPLVSIVTPSYNQGRFIRDTIDSVLSQSYTNIEYIVVDGGSTDETVDILKSYRKRIRWISEPDRGQAHAINKGLHLSRGAYLCYLNSDDTLEADAIRRMVEEMEGNPQVDVVYGKADFISEQGDFVRHYNTCAWDLERFKGECFICQPATMWSRRCGEKFGEFDETLQYVMDYEYWTRIAMCGGVLHYLPEKLANSREYCQTKSQSARGPIFREIQKISRKHFGSVSKLWRLQWFGYLVFERTRLPRGFLEFFYYFAKRALLVYEFIRRSMARMSIGQGVSRLALTVGKRIGGRYFMRRASCVTGLHADGWASERIVISYENGRNVDRIVIEGRSPTQQTLTITNGTKHIYGPEKVEGEFTVDVPLDDLYLSRIEVACDGMCDSKGDRKRGFFLNYTNLFSDLDVQWTLQGSKRL